MGRSPSFFCSSHSEKKCNNLVAMSATDERWCLLGGRVRLLLAEGKKAAASEVWRALGPELCGPLRPVAKQRGVGRGLQGRRAALAKKARHGSSPRASGRFNPGEAEVVSLAYRLGLSVNVRAAPVRAPTARSRLRPR